MGGTKAKDQTQGVNNALLAGINFKRISYHALHVASIKTFLGDIGINQELSGARIVR